MNPSGSTGFQKRSTEPLPAVDGRIGWPWQAGQVCRPISGKIYPKITIVTPSFNQGAYLEETIRSVLLQGYPNFEYIIIDGGSNDDSVQIIKKYESSLSYWVSEPDRGQSHAINKGMERATGDILAYLNSDDIYEPGALNTVVKHLDPQQAQWCWGDGRIIDANSGYVSQLPTICPEDWIQLMAHTHCGMQPSAFWTRKLWDECGPFDSEMFFSFDWDLFSRFLLKKHVPVHISTSLSCARYHSSTKTSTSRHMQKKNDGLIWARSLKAAPTFEKLKGLSYLLATPWHGWEIDVLRLICSHLVWPPSLMATYHRDNWRQRLLELKIFLAKRVLKHH